MGVGRRGGLGVSGYGNRERDCADHGLHLKISEKR
jgi:hypothetical protein